MNISTPVAIVAGLISLLTWAVTRKVLKDHSTMDNPIIPVCVAGLSFLGLTTMGEGWATSILLLYAAMALAILLTLLFAGISGHRFRKPDDIQDGKGRDDESEVDELKNDHVNQDNGERQ